MIGSDLMMARMAGSALLSAFILLGASGDPRAQQRAATADDDWMLPVTVLTMAPDGAWGAATEAYVNDAIAGALARCRTMSGAKLGCGAYFSTIRAGWSLGIRCGDHMILSAERTLDDADKRARRREDELRAEYADEMPPCVRAVTVDPSGKAISPRPGVASGPATTR
jgi:hypothetical protein